MQRPVPQQLALPIWPAPHRAIPNAFSRSALFGVANRRDARRFLRDVTIAAVNGITITYRGEELRQDDEDVFLQIMHMARGQPVSHEVSFTASAMLRELGWTRNSTSIERLIQSISRMAACSVSVTVDHGNGNREGFTGSLVRAFRWREDGGKHMRRWTLLLEPDIVDLFGPLSHSRLEWSMRRKLSPLAKWLHSFYAGHAVPYPYRTETLRTLSGSRIAGLHQYRYKLREALQQLVDVGFLAQAKIDPRTDLVMVTRKAQGGTIDV